MASPRADAGVMRETASALAVIVGAHRAPHGISRTASSHQWWLPRATTIVRTAIGASRDSAGSRRCIVP